MASSNRHWPSMFKSKPCNTHHHQWQHHDINSSLLPTACHRSSPYSSGCEERSPEPKPRWNPKPEQIRILEAIFNSGMVNPPRDEIRKIRAQLQEYGQVGDANVFYWFQNRKSRSKIKNRNLQTTTKNQTHHQSPPISVPITSTTNKVPTSSSSSSENKACFSLLNSPTASVNQQPYFGELLQEPYFFPPGAGGFCFPELGNVMNHHGNDQTVGSSSEVLLTDLMMMNNRHGIITKSKVEDEKMKLQPQLSYSVTAPAAPTSVAHSFSAPPTTTTVPSNINYIQGVDESSGLGQAKSTVFINDVAFEVAVGPFNVREAFGDDAVLIHSSGQPVVTNEWGVTLQSLQHGTFYYLLRTLTQVDTVDLI